MCVLVCMLRREKERMKGKRRKNERREEEKERTNSVYHAQVHKRVSFFSVSLVFYVHSIQILLIIDFQKCIYTE